MTVSTNAAALNASARATRAIHAGQEPDPTTGAVVTPIYMTSTFKQDGVGGLRNGYDYSRSINPTRNSFDEQLAAVEGAKYALSFSSGLAAIDVLLRSTLKPGDNILLGNDVYGGTYRLLSKVFVPWGIGLDVVDITDTAAVSAALAKKQYAYIWAETPSNPLLNITDIAATAAVAHAHGTKVVVDNTFASPVLQHPLADGADVVVYSTTKYIGGHSDVVGGAVVLNDKETRDAVAFLQNAAGAVPSPFDSWLDIRGLKTLDLRVKRHSANALKVAEWLESQPSDVIERVWYPGLESHPGHEIAARQMHGGFGGIVSVHGGSIRRLPLPIAGLMTSADPQEVNAVLHDMLVAARAELGIPEDVEPFMTLSFMALPVIPELKLTARGLFNVNTFSFVGVEAD